MDANFNAVMDKLLEMSGQMADMLVKQDKQEVATNELKMQLAELTKQNLTMTKTIADQGDRINACEQALRATSIRIIGLPVTKDMPAQDIMATVYTSIVRPVFEAAKSNGEIDSYPPQRFSIDSAFCIPSRNPSSCPVIVKLASSAIKSLVFQYKKEALPSSNDPSSGRSRPKFGIYEDLTPANFNQFRAIAEDPRTTAVWTYGGQIKFRVKDRDNIYRVRALSDTVDSLTKTSLPNQ